MNQPVIDPEALAKYSDEQLEGLIMKLGIFTDTLNAGPMSNGQRMQQACRAELARRRNLRRQGRVTIREER